MFWITVDKKLWLKAADNCKERWKLWNRVGSNPVLVSKRHLVLEKTKWTDLVESALPRSGVRNSFYLKMTFGCALIPSFVSSLQHCRLPPSPCQLSQSCSELSCMKSVSSTLAWGSFTPTVVMLCSQILHPSLCQASSLAVPGLRGRGSVWLGSSQLLLGMVRAIARNGEDSRETWWREEEWWDFTCSVQDGVTPLSLCLSLSPPSPPFFYFFFKIKCLNVVDTVSETQNSICSKFWMYWSGVFESTLWYLCCMWTLNYECQ